MPPYYPVGKLPAEDLDRILRRYASGADPRLLVGPGIGRDAAVISFGPGVLVSKTDPITFATEEIGWYAVNINANDVAAMGATPRWFLSTILLPEDKTDAELVDRIFSGLADACRELGITLCGGHTEITHGLDRPLLIGQMLGETTADGYVSGDGARLGDRILLTKGIAIEATALIAMEKSDEVRTRFSDEFLETCRRYLRQPGLSVVREARLAMETGGVRAMHDPTEGGLASGLREIAVASGVGMLIEEDRIPLLPEPEALCAFYGLDPLGVIASGALLIVVEADRAKPLAVRLGDAGIPVAEIGSVQPPEFGIRIRSKGEITDLPAFDRDEIGKVFEAT
ncbi:MAG: hydrogenase expression/formation protein [Gemmatimonadetes bacterium]|nr:hydrogenase expression/formation protein [Gemmatimonadota bacterium]MYG14973.1 hydrogenase expression/formation protein [Gemmatimonadota bacterium]